MESQINNLDMSDKIRILIAESLRKGVGLNAKRVSLSETNVSSDELKFSLKEVRGNDNDPKKIIPKVD